MGLIELDKELATAVKTSLENIKAEIQTNLDSAPTSLKEINPNSSEFIIKEKKKVTYTYTTVEGEEKEAFYYRTVVKADYTQNALNYDNAYGNFTTRVTEIKDAITEKIDKVTTALQTVLDLVNTFETQEGISMSSALGDASENTFEFLAAYGDASSLTSLVGPGTFGTSSLDNIYEIEDDEDANVDSAFLNLNNPDAEGLSEAEQQTIEFMLSQLQANGCINEETGEVIIDGNVVGTLDKLSVNALLATSLGATIKANMEKELSVEAYEFVGDTVNYKGLEPEERESLLSGVNSFDALKAAISNGVSVSAAVTGLFSNVMGLTDEELGENANSIRENISRYIGLVNENSELFSDEEAAESFAYLAQEAGWPDDIISTVITGGNAGVAINNAATNARYLEMEAALTMPDEMIDMALKKRLASGTELTYEQRLEIVNDFAEMNSIKLPESVVAEMVNDLGNAEPSFGEIVDNFLEINDKLGFGVNSVRVADGQTGPEINVNFAERYYETVTEHSEVPIPDHRQVDIHEWWSDPISKVNPADDPLASGELIDAAMNAEIAIDKLDGKVLGAEIGSIVGTYANMAKNPNESPDGSNTGEGITGFEDYFQEKRENFDGVSKEVAVAVTAGKVVAETVNPQGNVGRVDVEIKTDTSVGKGYNYSGTYNNEVKVDPPRQPQPEPPRQPQPETPRQPQPETPSQPQQPTQPAKQEHHHSSKPTGVADVPKIEDVFNNETTQTTHAPEIKSSDELKSSAILGAAGLGATTVLSGGGSSLPSVPSVPNVPSVPSVSAPGVAITPSAPTMTPTPNAGMPVTAGPDMMVGQDMSSVMSQGSLNAGPMNSAPTASGAVNAPANSNVNAQTMAQNSALNNANNTNGSNSANANNSSNTNNSTHTTQSSSSKGELGKGKSSYGGGSSEGSSSSKSKGDTVKNKTQVNDDVENDVENNNHEAEIDPNATEGVLSDSAYVQMLAKEEKQVKIATATTSSVGLLMFALKFADVITWGSLGLSAGALGLFYTSFRVHKAKKIKKLQHLIIIEREERIRKLKDRNERLIIIENTKEKGLEAVSNVEKEATEDKKDETTETVEKVSKVEENTEEIVKKDLVENQTSVSEEENVQVTEENTDVEEKIEEVTEPEGYGSIIIPDGDDAFQSAEEVIFGAIPDRFSKEETEEDNQEDK